MNNDYWTIAEVSELLGVEERRVRALAQAEAFTRIHRGVYDRRSVERYHAERGTVRTRTWEEDTAWGAIALLSGKASADLGDVQTSRLRASLREITDPEELTSRLRARATVTTWAGNRAALERVRAELVVPGRKRLRLVEDDSIVDGYASEKLVAQLVRDYKLVESSSGSITLRYTRKDMRFVEGLALLNRTLAAVDAASSLDPRERGVGESHLISRLDLFRENSKR